MADDAVTVEQLRAELRQGYALRTAAQAAITSLREREAVLVRDVERSRAEHARTLEQQAAIAGLLRVIAASPADLQAVLDALVDSATRLCEADDVMVSQVDGDVQRMAA